MDDRRKRHADNAEPNTQSVKISRRTMVTGMVATTAVVAIMPMSNLAYGQTAEPKAEDMVAFLLLSDALTGIDRQTLAPEFSADATDILNSDPGVDPINIKNTYFDWLRTHADPTSFAKLLQSAKDNSKSSRDIIDKVNGSDDGTKFLARSIVLMWYLGSWYVPKDLQDSATPGTRKLISSQVISAKAYTQGLVWQIAGAHPMGYSNLQFGYWSRDPHDLGPDGKPIALINLSKS